MSDSEGEEDNDFDGTSVPTVRTHKGQKFILVWNNYSELDRDLLIKWIKENCTQGIVAREDAGTAHLQCAFITKTRKTFASMKKIFGSPHLAAQRKPYLANFRYCNKEDKSPFIHGPLPTTKIIAGTRTDQELAREFILTATSWRDVMLNADIGAYVAGHLAWARALYQVRPNQSVELPIRLYNWQSLLVEELKMAPHPRKIIWFYDAIGNHGKSTLANVLCNKYNAVELPNKSADAAYMYDRQPIILWDFSRTVHERVQYGLIEQFKNGRITNTKYESHSKVFPTPHIIVFANFEPDRNAWSQDRYDVREYYDMDFADPENYQIPDDVTDYIPSPIQSPRRSPRRILVEESPPRRTPVPLRRQGAFCSGVSPVTSPITSPIPSLPPRKRTFRRIVFEESDEDEQ